MNRDLALILNECLERIRAGASVQDCLASFPAEAEELAPLLETLVAVRELQATEPPLPERVAAGRERLLAQAAELRQQEVKSQPRPFADWPSRLRQRLAAWVAPRPMAGRWAITAIITLVLLILLGGSAVVAAESSLPGDVLYPVKRTTQDVRLRLALDEAARAELERHVQAQRRADALAVAQQGRRVTVDFAGEIESLRAGTWVVSGVTLLVDAQTVVEGPRQLGLTAQVLALSQGDGTLRAQRIVVMAPIRTPTPTSFVPSRVATETATTAPTLTLSPAPSSTATPRPAFTATWAPTATATPIRRPAPIATATLSPTASATRAPTVTAMPQPQRVVKVRFEGEIQSKDGNVWRIGGQRVVVTDDTVIQPSDQAQVGAWVLVTAERQSDGSLRALRITVLRPAATPEVVEFSGPIRSFSEQEWVVGEHVVRITPQTTIEGTPQVGATAHVRALRLADGALVAERIRVEPPQQVVQFEGPIQEIQETWWVVGGRRVTLDANTVVEGTPQVGHIAEVTAQVLAEGGLLATHITVRPPPSSPTWTPSPTATTPATATWTPSPTATTPATAIWTPSPVATTPAMVLPILLPTATVPATVPPTLPPTVEPAATPAPRSTVEQMSKGAGVPGSRGAGVQRSRGATNVAPMLPCTRAPQRPFGHRGETRPAIVETGSKSRGCGSEDAVA